ncbi:hypothetical protein CPB86DRAFT_379837 [Serendipita vermifera]|nr:hypothetical protein CPB86DRAFT_379837 [Serendipita vermifera]
MLLVDKPNHILERQKVYQASHAPIYLRAPRSRLYVGSFFAGFAVAMVGTSFSIYKLVRVSEYFNALCPCLGTPRKLNVH